MSRLPRSVRLQRVARRLKRLGSEGRVVAVARDGGYESAFESEGSVVAITNYVSLCRKASAGGGTIFLS